MESAIPVVLMLGAVLVSSVVAQIFPKAPAPLVQIALGVMLAVTPLPVNVTLDPELFLLFFIAPLLYWDAMESDKKALWSQRTPVLSLALGLVIVIVLVVGFFTHLLVPSIPLAAAFALGAALGPTDAVAVTTLGKRLAISKEQNTLLQGECLLNDASGVVSFQFAIAAMVTGAFSVVDAGISLAFFFIGGILLGIAMSLVKTACLRAVRKTGLEDVTFHVLLQVLTPFVFYIVAEELGVSGILAVVAAGIVDSFDNRSMLPSAARLNIVSTSVWKVLSFALNGTVFVLLGTLLPSATIRTWAGSIPNTTLVLDVVLITIVLSLVRFLWCLAMVYVGRGKKGEPRGRVTKEDVLSSAVLTLGGPKGAVTLSICLTIPRVVGGEVLQCRELIIFLGAGVILLTLLMANFIVPLLVPKKQPSVAHEDEVASRIQILRNVVSELAHDDGIADKRALRRVIATYEKRIDRIKGSSAYRDADEDNLHRLAIGWETIAVNRAIHEGRVAPVVGYGYLAELQRRLSRYHHRGELLWFLRNATGWFDAMRRTGFQDFGSSDEVREKRRAAREALRLECTEFALEKLQQIKPEEGHEPEALMRVTMEYQRTTMMLGSGVIAPKDIVAEGTAKVDTVMRRALQLEREQIRRAYDDGLISRELARVMRDNVATVEYGLQA